MLSPFRAKKIVQLFCVAPLTGLFPTWYLVYDLITNSNFSTYFLEMCPRALHVLFDLTDFLCSALSGLKTRLSFTQGVALGWYVAALSGLRKIKSLWECKWQFWLLNLFFEHS